MISPNGLTDLIEHTKNMQEILIKWQKRKKLFATQVNHYLLHIQGNAKTPEEAAKNKVQAFKHLESKKKCDSKIHMLENAIHNNQKIISLSKPKLQELKPQDNISDAKRIEESLKSLIIPNASPSQNTNKNTKFSWLKNLFKTSVKSK